MKVYKNGKLLKRGKDYTYKCNRIYFKKPIKSEDIYQSNKPYVIGIGFEKE